MMASSIARLKRLLDLAGHIYDLRTREAAGSQDHQLTIAQALASDRTHAGSESFVEIAFPGLLARRAAKLGRELAAADMELQRRRSAAASARCDAKGLEGKLNRAVTVQEQKRSASELEYAIESYLRVQDARLP